MRAPIVCVLLALIACGKSTPKRELDLDLIKIVTDARLRTDIVGEGDFAQTASYVLVDAENTANEGAYVTLGGDLIDPDGKTIGTLNLMSLWIPPHEKRLYALVDSERKPRAEATKVRIKVRGANAGLPAPTVRVTDVHTYDDHGQLVISGYLENDANRDAQVMVVAAFHDERDRPMKRPFYVVKIARKQPGEPGDCPDVAAEKLPMASKCPVQFVGPKGAKTAQLFVADTVY